MYRNSKSLVKLSSQINLLGTRPFTTSLLLRRTYNTDYTEGTHHVAPTNPLDELLNHLEATKVSDPRTVSVYYQLKYAT